MFPINLKNLFAALVVGLIWPMQNALGQDVTQEQILMADVNWDGIVDIQDIVAASSQYNNTRDNPNFNPQADITHDGVINILDLVHVARAYGREVPLPFAPTTAGGTRLEYWSEIDFNYVPEHQLRRNEHGVPLPKDAGLYLLESDVVGGKVHVALGVWNGVNWVKTTSLQLERGGSLPGEESELYRFTERRYYRVVPGFATVQRGFNAKQWALRVLKDMGTLESTYGSYNIPYFAVPAVTFSEYDGNSNSYNAFLMRALGYVRAMSGRQEGSAVIVRDSGGTIRHLANNQDPVGRVKDVHLPNHF